LKLYYEGKDITENVSVNACFHDMYAEGQSDLLIVRFNDISGLWDKWGSKIGDTMAVEMEAARTGKMYVHSIIPENGKLTIRALSVPCSYIQTRSKAWEQVRLMQLGQEIAARHGLNFKSFGVEDRIYPYLKQDEKNDFEFLHERCTQEGCAFLIFDGTLIVYSKAYIESQEPSQTLILSSDARYEFDASEPGRTGVIWNTFTPALAAGSVADLRVEEAPSWNSPIFIQHIRHDYVKRRSKIFFRVMEGW